MTDDPPNACSCAALRKAARYVTRFYDEALAPFGLGLNQYSILASIDRLGRIGVGDLASCLVMDRSTLGHLLRPLEKRGLMTIDVGEQDRRQRTIALTADGVALTREARPPWAEAERRFEAAFGAEDAARLRRMLERAAAIEFGGRSPRLVSTIGTARARGVAGRVAASSLDDHHESPLSRR